MPNVPNAECPVPTSRPSTTPLPRRLPAAAAGGRWRRVPRVALASGAAALYTLAAFGFGGCGREEEDLGEVRAKPVAIVEQDTVTVGEAATYMRAARIDRTREGLDRAIEDLIAIELVKVAAGDEKLTPEQEALRREWTDQLRMYQFRDSVIYKSVSVPDSAVEAYYKERVGEEIKARHILVPFSASATAEEKKAAGAKAEQALGEARGGADFAELSRKYSEGSTAANGGDLGWFGRGAMVPAFERAAFALEPGQISDVVETRFGYHVIKVEDRRKKTLEEVRPQIESVLAQPLQREAEDRFVQRMMAESGLQFYEANVDTLVALFSADSVGSLPDERRKLPVATWDKGVLTVGDIVDRFRALPPENRAAVRALDRDRMLDALAPLVRNEMLVARAEADGIRLDPDRQRKLDDRVRGLVVGEMLRQRVKQGAVVSDADVRAAWTADSTAGGARYGKSFAEAQPKIRQALLDERMARANSWEGQREMIHEIARHVRDRAEVERVEDNYALVLELVTPAPAGAAAETASRGGGATAPAGARTGGARDAVAGGADVNASGPATGTDGAADESGTIPPESAAAEKP